jgi:hypothetical protein
MFHEALVAGFEQIIETGALKLAQAFLERLSHVLHHGFVIAVRAAQGLADDFVYQAKGFQARCGDA